MSGLDSHRGGAPVGLIADLPAIEAASVVYLRLWCDGPAGRANMRGDFLNVLGAEPGEMAMHCFEQLFALCARHGRRPLMRHSVRCQCLGADESCFAHFIAAAADGAREDAMLMATLLVRPDMAPAVTSLAAEFGMALRRMGLRAPSAFVHSDQDRTTVH